MSAFLPFLIKKNDDAVVNPYDRWGVMVKSIPFNLAPEIKPYASTDWPDEDGDDEYIPSTPRFKAYEMEISFVYVGEYNTANNKIREFWNYVKSGELQIYDTYTGIGRKGIRYVGYSSTAFHRRNLSGDVVEFKIKFKVNNPVDDIILEQ